MSVRITRVEVFGVAMPLVGTFTSGGVSKDKTQCVVVRVSASDGNIGLSSIDPSTRAVSPHTAPELARAIRDRLGPAVMGHDPRCMNVLADKMHALVPRQAGAVVGVELAVADLLCKQQGIALHTFLGGARQSSVRFNGWIGELPAAAAAAEAARWLAAGFKSAKIKVGSGVDADAERVAAVRAAVGDAMELRIDANEQYEVEGALALCDAVRGFDLQLFEQPVRKADLAGLRQIRERGGIAIMADESIGDHESLVRVIKAECADFVKFGIEQAGGLMRARAMLETAKAAGLPVVLGHGFGLDLSTMAEIMLGATSDNVVAGLECVGPLKVTDTVVTQRLDLSAGFMAVPEGPGLGLEVDESKLAQYQFDL